MSKETIQNICTEFDIDVRIIQTYHWRLEKDGFRSLDVFPGSLKCTLLSSGKFESHTLESLSDRIINHFHESN